MTDPTRRAHWSRKLRALDACEEAVTWARTQPSLAVAWRACQRGDWMLRLTSVLEVKEPVELRIDVMAYALEAARKTCGKEVYWAAVENAHRLVREALRGEGDLSAAWSAAWSAAESAARSAARSAAWSAAWSAAESAARSAARSAAESAAWSAAWSAAESDLADIVRKHIPKAPTLTRRRKQK